MKIAFITSTFPTINNRQKGVFNLRAVKQLIHNNVDVTVFKLRAYKPFEKLIKRSDFEGIKIYEFYLLTIPNFIPKSQIINIELGKICFWIISKFLFLKFDILHSVGLHYASFITNFIAKKYNVTHIAQGIGSDVNIHLLNLNSTFIQNNLNYTKHLVFNSKSLQETFKTKVKTSINTSVIYRGVDVDFFKEKKNESNSLILLYLGGIPHEYPNLKGGLFVLKIWEQIHSNPNIILKFGGPNSIIFHKYINEEYINNRFQFIDYINYDKVAIELSSADIILMPSENEGLPNLALEAMSAKTLVIGSNKPFFQEIIENHQTGFLVDFDVNKWINLLNELNKDKTLIKNISSNAFTNVSLHFNKTNYPTNLIKLYNDCQNN
jgi:glycosyltransferase involved in cell wall biosynthesis